MNTNYWNSDLTLTQSEFETFSQEVRNKLFAAGIDCYMPNVIPSERHESLCLVCSPGEVDLMSIIQHTFEINRMNQEGAYFVFKFQGIKIELYATRVEEMEFAIQYLAYDGASSILGKILHRMGMKLNHRGLFYLIRESMFDGDSQNGHIMEEVLLTTCWSKTISLLSISCREWRFGFSSKEELFEYITKSREFSPATFEEQTNVTPVLFEANKRADILLEFISWVGERGWERPTFPPRKAYRKGLFGIFTHLRNRMFANSGKWLRKREVYRKINVDLIIKWLSAKDSDAHKVLHAFKQHHDELEILALSSDDIRAAATVYLQRIQFNPDQIA